MSMLKIVRAKQKFESLLLNDIAGTIESEVDRVFPSTKIKKGDSVAITVGSRGIANLKDIISSLASSLKKEVALSS